ncbi:hypothetical protein PG999_001505 [Apiospora kogelbergensis]|uniref:Uncharacterized protein n=1 Tax=Apiospora kogelbergensis TaxID=1337665 RepID=A0AAW0REG7_9PEZI
MSTLKIARVALQWSDDSFLTTPDPSDARIVFESQTAAISPPSESSSHDRDESCGVFLQLSIPVKLKGSFAHAPVHIHVHPSQIQSAEYTSSDNVPEAVQTKLSGRLARLSMTLSEPVHFIVPCNTLSPLRARSRASGQVLDALRTLSRATQLSIYMEDQDATRAHLLPLCALLAAGRAVPLSPYTETFRLFGGSGGRRWVDDSMPPSTEEDDSLPPPRYDELGPGPPMPPISTEKDQGTKRRRQRLSNSSTSSDVLAHADAGLQTKKPDLRASPPRPSMVQQRLDILEGLVQAQARQIDELLADNKLQKERIRECESDVGAARLAAERAHARVEELELEMAVQRDDMQRLEGDVQYCREQEDDLVEIVTDTVSGRIVDIVADAVTERISTRGLIARNISFSLGDE